MNDSNQQRQFLWRLARTQVLWIVGIVIASLVMIIVLGYVYEWKWTGLVKDARFPKRTLWDWLELLVVPAVLAGGIAWFNQQHQELQGKRDEKRAHHDVLQEYLTKMEALVLEKHLTTEPENSDVRKLARSRTLMALDATGPIQQARILRFLYEMNLTQSRGSNKTPIVSLRFASLPGIDLHHRRVLEGANLNRATLTNAVLTNAKLPGANLSGAYLMGADLRGATLAKVSISEADLTDADLTDADLTDAKGLTAEQLATCKSLKGATMPNGQKYEEWIKDKKAAGRTGRNSGSS